MMVVCASVFLGTIYPLLVEVFSNNKISVGEPYFNSVTIPIMIPAILVMGMGPILSWGKVDVIGILTKSLPSILFSAAISSIFFWIYGSYNMLGLAGIILAFWIISNILLTTIQQLIVKNKEVTQNNILKYSTGMIMAHFGIALLILGITGSSIWQKERIIRMKVNDETSIHNYNIVFKEISEVTGPNYVALQGNFWVYNKKKNIITKLKPENRFYPVTNNSTTEASIHTNLARDLYVVLGNGDINEGWIVRIYYNPLVIWIWIGAFAIFLGGLFSMKNNLKKLKRLSI
jgi:cytochrome c-type biogenesis protein CcmF